MANEKPACDVSDPALVALGERLRELATILDPPPQPFDGMGKIIPRGTEKKAAQAMREAADALARPVAAPPEGTLTREQAETRLDENELACICRVAMEHGIPAAHCAMFDALFPHDGSRT